MKKLLRTMKCRSKVCGGRVAMALLATSRLRTNWLSVAHGETLCFSFFEIIHPRAALAGFLLPLQRVARVSLFLSRGVFRSCERVSRAVRGENPEVFSCLLPTPFRTRTRKMCLHSKFWCPSLNRLNT